MCGHKWADLSEHGWAWLSWLTASMATPHTVSYHAAGPVSVFKHRCKEQQSNRNLKKKKSNSTVGKYANNQFRATTANSCRSSMPHGYRLRSPKAPDEEADMGTHHFTYVMPHIVQILHTYWNLHFFLPFSHKSIKCLANIELPVCVCVCVCVCLCVCRQLPEAGLIQSLQPTIPWWWPRYLASLP